MGAGGRCLVGGVEAVTGEKIEVAVPNRSCDIWWRHVSSDVMLPMTELALPFVRGPAG